MKSASFRYRIPLAARIVLTTGITLLLCLGIHAYLNITYQKEAAASQLSAGADRLGLSIVLGTRYAMMVNSRHELHQIVSNVANHPDIVAVRIYNKDGEIKFSNHPEEIDTKPDSKDTACIACHRGAEPRTSLSLKERTRHFVVDDTPYIGTLFPVYNEEGCSSPDCHAHDVSKKVLGALDVIMRADRAATEALHFENRVLALSGGIYLVASVLIVLLLRKFVSKPVEVLRAHALRIGMGKEGQVQFEDRHDEIGELAAALFRMEKDIQRKQSELNRQKALYQDLFEQVPCMITVQDRDFTLLQYNKGFSERFAPAPGARCYEAYKGKNEPCTDCPVAKTFATGRTHCSEEKRVNPDGSRTHWLVHAAPVYDEDGNLTAAMEMCIDISARKAIEEQLQRSEKKYYAIFNNIPNSVFVLDAETLDILDCNSTAEAVYAEPRESLCVGSFLRLFPQEERARYASQLKAFTVINRARNVRSDGSAFFVDIKLSPAEYNERHILLVTTSDITERLETELKLIQAGKMATLGEMATGVAHELNQPLTVIKTASSFIMRKIRKEQPIEPAVLQTMAQEIDSHVDRASRIINHMREFGRQSELALENVDVNEVLKASTDFFARQLTLRDIELVWELTEALPHIMAIPNRLEQVVINLLLNARDAIEERFAKDPEAPRRITLRTLTESRRVIVEVEDTGSGIPASLQDKIFEPFFTTKGVGKGTGLGLSISYGLVQDFGGTIKAVRMKEGGSRFTLFFPSTSSPQKGSSIAEMKDAGLVNHGRSTH